MTKTKIVKYVSFFLIAFSIAGCSDNITGPKDVELNQEFELGIKQSAHIKDTDLLITFNKVVEDSRCPKVGDRDGDCLWVGNGKIELEVHGSNQPRIDSLNTYLDPKELSIYNYKITLKELNPYPELFQEINPEDYKAKIIITQFE